jgi:predicted site-specific integrase-resolvase
MSQKKTKADPNDVMPTDEVAAMLGIVPKTVLKYMRGGRLSGRQYAKGGPYYFERADVERFKEQCRVVR